MTQPDAEFLRGVFGYDPVTEPYGHDPAGTPYTANQLAAVLAQEGNREAAKAYDVLPQYQTARAQMRAESNARRQAVRQRRLDEVREHQRTARQRLKDLGRDLDTP